MPRQANAQMKIRLSDDIRDMLHRAAIENNISVNAEITRRLRETFGMAPLPRLTRAAPPPPSPESQLEAVARRLDALERRLAELGLVKGDAR